MLKGNPLGSIEDRQGLGIKSKTSEASVSRVSENRNRGSCKAGNVNRQHSSRSWGVGQIHSNTMQRALVAWWVHCIGYKEMARLVPFPQESENLIGMLQADTPLSKPNKWRSLPELPLYMALCLFCFMRCGLQTPASLAQRLAYGMICKSSERRDCCMDRK